MSDQRRGPVLPDATPVRRKSSSTQRRSSYSSSGSSRSASRSSSRSSSRAYESSSRRSADYGHSSDRRYSSGSGNKRKKRKFKSSFYFLTGLTVYAIILLILCAIFLGYADRSLRRFEKSQSTYFMDEYVKNFKASLDAGTIPEGLALDSSNAFEPAEKKLGKLIAATNGKELTYEKDGSSYNTEEPIYNILAGGQPVAQVQLEATNAKVVFAILTVMDWNVTSLKLLGQDTGSDYYINAPEGYSITVNGVAVGSEYLTGNASGNPLLVNAKEYVSVSDTVEYKIPGLSEEPVVEVRDGSGNEVACSKDGNRYFAAVVSGEGSGEMPSDLEETALEIAKTWSLFMTADLTGGNHGLKTIQQYLIPGSAYDEMAKGWAGGIDITFTSAHTLSNPPFKNIAVTNYIRYSEDCFSCHIYFDKPMHLTRTGADIVDTTDSDYVFVRYEGKWCLVDMSAAQQSEESAD